MKHVPRISQDTACRILQSEKKQIRHGKYTYRATQGEIQRCNTRSVGCVWTDAKGNVHDGWKPVQVVKEAAP